MFLLEANNIPGVFKGKGPLEEGRFTPCFILWYRFYFEGLNQKHKATPTHSEFPIIRNVAKIVLKSELKHLDF